MSYNSVRCILLVAAMLLMESVSLDGQQLSFFRGYRDYFHFSSTALTGIDVNKDGHINVVAFSGELRVFLGNANGRFVAGPRSPSSGSDVRRIVAADFTGDGNIDIVIFGRYGLVTL